MRFSPGRSTILTGSRRLRDGGIQITKISDDIDLSTPFPIPLCGESWVVSMKTVKGMSQQVLNVFTDASAVNESIDLSMMTFEDTTRQDIHKPIHIVGTNTTSLDQAATFLEAAMELAGGLIPGLETLVLISTNMTSSGNATTRSLDARSFPGVDLISVPTLPIQSSEASYHGSSLSWRQALTSVMVFNWLKLAGHDDDAGE